MVIKSKLLPIMNKIKFFAIASVAFLLSTRSYGQINAAFSVGYGSPMASGDYYQNRTRDNGTDIREQVKYSLGKGLNLNAIFGYGINENMEIELGINYLMGAETQSVDTDLRNAPIIQTDTYVIKGSGLSFAPGLKIKASGDGLKPYLRLAPVISLPGITEDFTQDDGIDLFHTTTKYRKGTAFGISSALGTTMEMGGIKIFGELYATSLSYSPKQGEYTEVTLNGTDFLAQLDVIDKQWVYLDTIDRNANINITEPDQLLKVKFPFSSVGLRLGVSFSF